MTGAPDPLHLLDPSRSSTAAKVGMVVVHLLAIGAGIALGLWVFEAVTT